MWHASPGRSPGAASPRQLEMLSRSQQRGASVTSLPMLPAHHHVLTSTSPHQHEGFDEYPDVLHRAQHIQSLSLLSPKAMGDMGGATPSLQASVAGTSPLREMSTRSAPSSNIKTLGGSHIRRGNQNTSTTPAMPFPAPDRRYMLEQDLLAMEEVRLGSFVYDAVDDQYLCHVNHTMVPLTLAKYAQLECLSATCDGCTRHVIFDSSSPPTIEEVGAKRQRSDSDPSFDPYSDTSYFKKYDPMSTWFRCLACDVDMCAECASAIKGNDQFTVPYAECRQCNTRLRTSEASGHQCTTTMAWPTSNCPHPSTMTSSIKDEEENDFAIYSPLRTQHKLPRHNYLSSNHPVSSSSSAGNVYPPHLHRQSPSPDDGINQPYVIKKEEDHHVTEEEIKPLILPVSAEPHVTTKQEMEQRWEVTLYDIPATGTIHEFSSEYLGGNGFCSEGYRCCIKTMPRRMVLSFIERQKALELLRYVRRVQWRGHQLQHSGPPEKICIPVVQF